MRVEDYSNRYYVRNHTDQIVSFSDEKAMRKASYADCQLISCERREANDKGPIDRFHALFLLLKTITSDFVVQDVTDFATDHNEPYRDGDSICTSNRGVNLVEM